MDTFSSEKENSFFADSRSAVISGWGAVYRFRFLILGWTAACTLSTFWLSRPEVKKPEYGSEAVLLPPNFAQIKAAGNYKSDFSGLGAASYDQMTQLQAYLISDELMWKMTQKYELLNHYRLQNLPDPAVREKYLRDIYFDRLQVSVNKRAMMRISMTDESPDIARRLVAGLADEAQQQAEILTGRTASRQFLEKSYAQLTVFRQSLMDSARNLRQQTGIYRADKLSELLTPPPERLDDYSFLRNYDRMISLENKRRDLEGELNALNYDLQARRENLAQKPNLIEIAAPGISSPVKVRPDRVLWLIITGLLALVSGICVTIWFSAWWGREEGDGFSDKT